MQKISGQRYLINDFVREGTGITGWEGRRSNYVRRSIGFHGQDVCGEVAVRIITAIHGREDRMGKSVRECMRIHGQDVCGEEDVRIITAIHGREN